MTRFSCPRTCPGAGDPWCRFRPVLDRLGPARVNSHTVQVTVLYRDLDALQAAVVQRGGTWLGQGSRRLYDGTTVTGAGFTLPGWRYPITLTAGGKLAYDDYGGAWGNVADLDALRGAYALEAARAAAIAQGWLCEQAGADLLIHHPSGGTLTVAPSGAIDAAGFVGGACHEARTTLGLERLGLVAGTATDKPEVGQVVAAVRLPAR